MGKPHAGRHNRDVRVIDPTIVLDLEQLREVTLEDDELMGQILTALIEDTARGGPTTPRALVPMLERTPPRRCWRRWSARRLRARWPNAVCSWQGWPVRWRDCVRQRSEGG